MHQISDYSIFQNHVIGAHALWEFSKNYQDHEVNKQAPVLLLAIPVLPIVFNKRATDSIKNRKLKEGSLLKVITENKDIYIGLQERMEQSLELTFKSINIAVSANLLVYDRETSQLIPNRKYSPQLNSNIDYSNIISSSKRIGAWFSQLSLQEIVDYFNINF